MTTHSSEDDLILDSLAQELMARVRAGEVLSLEEDTKRHPDLAEEIRELFPLLMDVEGVGVDVTMSVGSSPPAPLTRSVEIPGSEILGELGIGGMGVVYEAKQTRLNRRVTLKMIRRSEGTEKELARFQTRLPSLIGRVGPPRRD